MSTHTESIATADAGPTPRAPRFARASRANRDVLVVRGITVLLVLVLWEGVARGPLAGSSYLAAPSVVLTEGLAAVFQPGPLKELGNTTLRFFEAFAIVAVVGIPTGVALGRLHRTLFAGARDVVSVLYALPMVPFYPLFVLWLGLGAPSEIAFGVIHGIVPVILISMTASAAVAPDLVVSGRTMGASALQRAGWVVLPAILPDAIGALKIGASLTLLGVLLAELMISIDGVGSFIAEQIVNHQAARLNAMILIVCVGVVLVIFLLSLVERRASRGRS